MMRELKEAEISEACENLVNSLNQNDEDSLQKALDRIYPASIEVSPATGIPPAIEINKLDLNEDLEAVDVITLCGIEMHVVRLKHR